MGQHSEDVVRPFLEEPNKRMRGRDKGLFQVVMYVKKTLFYNESRDWKRKHETQRGGSKESPFLETLKTQLHMLQGPEQADIILALLEEERLHQKCTNVLSKLKYSVILWFESSQDSFAAVGKKVSQ